MLLLEDFQAKHLKHKKCNLIEDQINEFKFFSSKCEKIDQALFRCIEVPYTVMKRSHELWPFLRKLATIFNTETRSDLQVGVKCLETAIFGAYANVEINLKDTDLSDSRVLICFWHNNQSLILFLNLAGRLER